MSKEMESFLMASAIWLMVALAVFQNRYDKAYHLGYAEGKAGQPERYINPEE